MTSWSHAWRGILTPSQEQALNTFLAGHPEARVAADLFAHTRITVPAAVYPDHAGLKKGGRVVPLMPVWAVRFAAAASLALLFGVGIWFLTRNEVPQTPQVAEHAVEPHVTYQPTDTATKVEQPSPNGPQVLEGSQPNAQSATAHPRQQQCGASCSRAPHGASGARTRSRRSSLFPWWPRRFRWS